MTAPANEYRAAPEPRAPVERSSSSPRRPRPALRGFLVPVLSLACLGAAATWAPRTPAVAAATVISTHPGLVGGEPKTLLHVLLALAAIVALAQICGRLLGLVGQPAVVGEMLAGILLGPSLLGRWAPGAAGFLVPAEIVPHLRVIAQIGVVLYMFLVGLELDVGHIGRRTRAAAFVSFAGIGVPLALGGVTGIAIFPLLAPAQVQPLVFASFFAVAMSMTAFPVLARIVADRGLQRSPLGVMALTCAAIGDATAWCLLAVVVGLAGRRPGAGLVTLGLTLAYVVLLVVVVRPLMLRLARSQETRDRLSRGTTASVFLSLLLSAIATEWIGIDALFGAFLLGAILPAGSVLATRLTDKLEDLVRVLLLPVFFASTGLHTELALVNGTQAWLMCALIVSVAFLGKLGGTSVAARLTGMGWRRANALGALMNTRGLMELIVLSVGLDLGIISAPLFTMMVIMALATTVAAGPLLAWIGSTEDSTSVARCSERCWCADPPAPAHGGGLLPIGRLVLSRPPVIAPSPPPPEARRWGRR